MKKSILFAAGLVVLGASAARAESIQLNDIDTNDCARAQSEINLLNGPNAHVKTECVGPGSYASDDGQVYAYRLYTTLHVKGQAYPGMRIELNDIDTNNPSFALSEVGLLNGSAAAVDVSTSAPGSFEASSGEYYRYRVYTAVTVY